MYLNKKRARELSEQLSSVELGCVRLSFIQDYSNIFWSKPCQMATRRENNLNGKDNI